MKGIAGVEFDVFDLRHPGGFIFFSLQGFVVYLIIHLALTNTQMLLNDSCVLLAMNSGNAIKTCGFTGASIVYNFIFFAVSALLIKTLRPRDCSSDAIFNSGSLLVLISVLITVACYRFNWADYIQRHAAWVFFINSVTVVAVSLAVVVLRRRASVPDITNAIKTIRVAAIYISMVWLYSFGAYWTADMLPET
jgi:hypothetical protein